MGRRVVLSLCLCFLFVPFYFEKTEQKSSTGKTLEGGRCFLKGSEIKASQRRAHYDHVPTAGAAPALLGAAPLRLATASAVTRERVGVDRDMLSRNFPLSSDSSIHLPELRPEPWAGFALAPSPCEPPGTVSSEAQPRASQLGLETRPGGQPALQSQPGPASPPGEAGRPRGSGQLPQRPLAAQGHPSPRQPSSAPPHVPGEPRPPDTNLPDTNRSIQECQDERLERGRGRVGVKLLLALCSPPAAP